MIIKNKKLFLILFLQGILISVYSCDGLFPTASKDVLIPDHTRNIDGAFHKETGKEKK